MVLLPDYKIWTSHNFKFLFFEDEMTVSYKFSLYLDSSLEEMVYNVNKPLGKQAQSSIFNCF